MIRSMWESAWNPAGDAALLGAISTVKRQVHGLGNKSEKLIWQRCSSKNPWAVGVRDSFVFYKEDGENKKRHAQSTKCSLQSEIMVLRHSITCR